MSIKDKVHQIESVFEALDQEISRFQQETGLGCISGCGACCKKPDIEATVLEFLPLAYHLFKTGKDIDVLEKLEKINNAPPCTFFSTLLPSYQSGLCTIYLHRGLICRLFGFSATKDKEGRPVLATCKIIKTELSEKYKTAVQSIEEGGFVPIMNQYYMKLLAIDLDLGNRFYPINEAIRIAIEKVSLSCAYLEQEEV
ncbi:MAG: YkgJ family cysteine cluster protein [Bacteroidota bacterium]|nr:YkgJ family cysteine cluster protein [Bacteroidota bacterium]